jgi:hypothetical protein
VSLPSWEFCYLVELDPQMKFLNVEARAHLVGKRNKSQSQHDRKHMVIDDPLPARLSGAMAIAAQDES